MEKVIFFQQRGTQGLSQGDPLSLFLFIIAIEGVDGMMRIASQNRWIRGFNLGNRAEEIMEISNTYYMLMIQ